MRQSFSVRRCFVAKCGWLLAVAFAAGHAAPAAAVVVPTIGTQSGTQLHTAFSGYQDLVQTGSAALQSVSATGFTGISSPLTNIAILNDNSLGAVDNPGATAISGTNPWSLTYTLSTSTPITAAGYRITVIDTFAGWNNNRFNQSYTVYYNTVSDPTFVSLGSYQTTLPAGGFGTSNATRITLSDTSGALAENVKQIRFDFAVPSTAGSQGAGYREIEIYGVAMNAPVVAPVGLSPVADATISRGSPTTNLGNAQFLGVKNDSGFDRKAYMRFDISADEVGFDLDLLETATLRLNFIDSATGVLTNLASTWTFDVYGLLDGNAGENWVEGDGGSDNSPAGEITWNNAPANNTTSGSAVIGAMTTYLGSFTITGKGIGEVDFTSAALKAFLQANSLNDYVTFIITRQNPATGPTDNYVHAFSSREDPLGLGPQLILTPIPEPSTFALLLAMLGLPVAWRRYFAR